MTYIVGLTGGIGSGKSAASQWFEQQGICVVDTDVVAREVVQVGQPLLATIAQQFGDWVLLADGQLDRSALRAHIFQHPNARQQLEAITHPAIRSAVLEQLNTANSAYVILVSPLLFETQQTQFTDRNLLIDSPEQLQLHRASQRDTQSLEQIEKIMHVQMPRQQKQQLADDIVLNDRDLTTLYAQLALLHQQYLNAAMLKNKQS